MDSAAFKSKKYPAFNKFVDISLVKTLIEFNILQYFILEIRTRNKKGNVLLEDKKSESNTYQN